MERAMNERLHLSGAMKDAERVESAQRRASAPRNILPCPSLSHTTAQAPMPMEIGNIKLTKPTKEDRKKFMRECLRACVVVRKGTWPRTAQKAPGTNRRLTTSSKYARTTEQ